MNALCIVVVSYVLALSVSSTFGQQCNGGVECILLDDCTGLYNQLRKNGNTADLTRLLRGLHCGFDNQKPKFMNTDLESRMKSTRGEREQPRSQNKNIQKATRRRATQPNIFDLGFWGFTTIKPKPMSKLHKTSPTSKPKRTPIPKTIKQPATVKPRVNLTIKPTAKPIIKTTVNPILRHTVRPTAKPIVKTAIQPLRKPVAPLLMKPTATVKPIRRPTVQSTIKATVKPIMTPTVKPQMKSAVRPPMKPTIKPIMRPPLQSINKPTVQQMMKPTMKAIVKPTIKPTVQQMMKLTVKPTMKPTVKPTIKPTVRHTMKSVKPTMKSTVRHTMKPTIKPTAQQLIKPTLKPMKTTAGRQATATVKPSIKHTMKPTLKQTVKPIVQTPVNPKRPERRKICCPPQFLYDTSSATTNSWSGNTNGGGESWNRGGVGSNPDNSWNGGSANTNSNGANNGNGGGFNTNSNGGHTGGQTPSDPSSLLPNTRICGIQNNDRIVGGTRADIDEHPWMALLRYDKPVGSGFYCGGVLISSRYVLTAAHCVKGQDLPTNWRLSQVRLGEWNTSSVNDCVMDDCATPVQDVVVEERIAHEEYDPQDTNQHNDIALLRLAKHVQFNDFVKPICLPLSRDLKNNGFDGFNMEVAGWGKTETRSESDVKLKVTVPVVSKSQCESVFNRVNREIINKQLCAGGLTGMDSCRGDSGGALMGRVPSSVNWYAVGVVSYGPSPCGTPGWPGVYTRVGAYVDWILSKIRP